MYFRQFYLGCLSHASYMIGSKGEAAVVDPQRDVEEYLSEANRLGLKIVAVIETHLHADFVSGHWELSRRTGAKIYFGRQSQAKFDHHPVFDGECLWIGKVRLEFLETPGHTPEGICILVEDTENPQNPKRLLTGDTLFVGDVGRPDLVGSKGYSSEQMASMLYDSLHQKILKLPDETEIYPAHGAGSACGKNISKERNSTIGEQKKRNLALSPMSREEFVERMTRSLSPPPRYFSFDAEMNRVGARMLEELGDLPALSPKEFERKAQDSLSTVLDVRPRAEFAEGHIPNSIHIELEGSYAPWAGALLDENRTIYLVAQDAQKAKEAQVRLARVGLENVAGYLEGGIDAWTESGRRLNAVAVLDSDQLETWIQKHGNGEIQVLDVRQRPELEAGAIPKALHSPLQGFHENKLPEEVQALEKNKPTVVVCASGYRSSIAASLLKKNNFQEVYNLRGGTDAWKSSGKSFTKPDGTEKPQDPQKNKKDGPSSSGSPSC